MLLRSPDPVVVLIYRVRGAGAVSPGSVATLTAGRAASGRVADLLEGIDVTGDPVHRYVDVVLVVPIYAVGMERLAGDEDEHLEVGGARVGIDFAD